MGVVWFAKRTTGEIAQACAVGTARGIYAFVGFVFVRGALRASDIIISQYQNDTRVRYVSYNFVFLVFFNNIFATIARERVNTVFYNSFPFVVMWNEDFIGTNHVRSVAHCADYQSSSQLLGCFGFWITLLLTHYVFFVSMGLN